VTSDFTRYASAHYCRLFIVTVVKQLKYDIFAGGHTLGRQYTWTEVTANQRYDILLQE